MLKKILLFSLAVLASGHAQSNIEELNKNINNIFTGKYFEQTQVAVNIFDLTERISLYQKNQRLLLHPASNMKVLTTSTGLLFLTPEYKFTTSIYYTGAIVNTTLYGDMYIEGGGDPDFTSADLDTLVNNILKLGIKEISGNLYGDITWLDTLFWGNGWMWDDDPSTDASYLSALNINDNAVAIKIKSTKAGEKAEIKIEPETEYVKLENLTLTVPNTPFNSYEVSRDWINRTNIIKAKGKIGLPKSNDENQDEIRLNVFRPEKYFMTLFKEKLLEKGVKFSGEILFMQKPNEAYPVYFFDRRYDSVIVNLNKTSDNLSAEMTLFALGEKYFGQPSSAQKGLKLIDSMIVLAGLNPSSYRLVDGSGVSHYNLVSAELLLEVLKYFYYKKPALFEILYNSFPVAGVDGTLGNRMSGTKAEKNVHAKTGTLSGVSTLSGYVTAANGNMIAFSILVQNYVGSSEQAREIQNKICALLAEYK